VDEPKKEYTWLEKDIPFLEGLLKGQKERMKELLEFSHGVIHSGTMDCKQSIKRYEDILKSLKEDTYHDK